METIKSKILNIALWVLVGSVLLTATGNHLLAQPIEDLRVQPSENLLAEPVVTRTLVPGLTIGGSKQEVLVRGYIAAEIGQSELSKEFSMFSEEVKSREIFLPGVEVHLENINNNDRSAPSRTDLSGRFSVYAPGAGKYRLCWKSPVYGAGCQSEKQVVTVGKKPRFLSTVNILVERRSRMTALVGKVNMADGGSVRRFEPYMNVNSFAKVSVRDSNGKALVEVRVNNFGDYLIPNIPVNQALLLEATLESETFIQEIDPAAGLRASHAHQINLRFKNNAPKINAISVTDESGKRIQNPNPGEVLTLRADVRDADGDNIKYRWQSDEVLGSAPQTNAAEIKWQTPTEPGRYSLSVLAYDQRGGYDKQTFSILVDGKGVPFGGVVVDVGGSPIADVEVEIVGNTMVKTDSQGRFSVRVKESDRYVFNARKRGYALNSRIYDRGVTGGRWILVSGQVVMVDPNVDTTISHDRNRKECPGPSSATARLGVAGESLLTPQWQDGKGNVIDPPSGEKRPTLTIPTTTAIPTVNNDGFFAGLLNSIRDFFSRKPDRPVLDTGAQPSFDLDKLEFEGDVAKGQFVIPRKLDLPPCGPGVTVTLQAGSVIDENGNPVVTPFEVTIGTVDVLSPQQMPGDETVVPIGGGGSYIESFGAGSLDLPKGFKLSKAAEVVIPVDRSRSLVSGPLQTKIPYLSYDENRGLWLEEGEMTLQNVNGVQSYVGKTMHFSPFNADNVRNDTAACLRVFSPGLPGNYDLEVSAPLNGNGSIRVVKKPIDNTTENEHVIYNLPAQTNITLAPMSQGADPHLYGYYIVNSGPSEVPSSSPSAPAGPPYDTCESSVVLTMGDAPQSSFGGEFLHGIGFVTGANLGFDDLTNAAPTGNALRDAIVQASRDYYNTIDPLPSRFDTLDKFRTEHGFSLDPNNPAAGETVVSYANSGDLGFGRDMHCMNNNGNIACYVSNYGIGYANVADGVGNGGGTPDIDDANAAGTRQTVGASAELATVAMEYTTIPGETNRIVKFYVYKKNFPNPGDYGRSISANLDGRGERPVPQLCMICHGGVIPIQANGVPAFSTPAQVDFGSRFVPFDHRFFTFPGGGAPSAAEELAIKTLNEDIVDLVPSGLPSDDPIHEVITAMYAGGVANQNTNSTVPGWENGASVGATGQKDFYDDVLTSGCRMCHIAQPFEELNFSTSRQFVHLENDSSVSPNNNNPVNNHLMLGTVQQRVCGDYLMPHALRTHDLFWGRYTDNIDADFIQPNLFMNQELQNFGDGILNPNGTWDSDLCTNFVSANVTDPSVFYEQTIQPIWNSKCVNCHIDGGLAANRALTDGESHDTLIDHNLVTPGNDAVGALITRTTASSTALRMPPNCFRAPEPPNGNSPCLLPVEIERIKVWIRNGAN